MWCDGDTAVCSMLQEQATSSQQTSKVAAVERLKHNLRQYGALARTARLVAEAAADATADARQLRLLLLVLENATFTCQENGTALVQLQVTTPQQNDLNSSQEEVQRQPFPALLVQVANQLLGADEDESCQQALHVNLSVLMNLSHQNAEGAALIADAGGMQIAAELIGQLLAHVQGSHADLCNKVSKTTSPMMLVCFQRCYTATSAASCPCRSVKGVVAVD